MTSVGTIEIPLKDTDEVSNKLAVIVVILGMQPEIRVIFTPLAS